MRIKIEVRISYRVIMNLQVIIRLLAMLLELLSNINFKGNLK